MAATTDDKTNYGDNNNSITQASNRTKTKEERTKTRQKKEKIRLKFPRVKQQKQHVPATHLEFDSFFFCSLSFFDKTNAL